MAASADYRACATRGNSGRRKRVIRLMQADQLQADRVAGFGARPRAIQQRSRRRTASPGNFAWAGRIVVWAGISRRCPPPRGTQMAVLLDLWSRRVGCGPCGHARDRAGDRRLASRRVGGGPPPRCISPDQRPIHQRAVYQRLLAQYGVRCSMSRPGNCWDNAVLESFFSHAESRTLASGPVADACR